MGNGHSLAKLQILCAPPNVFARFFAPAGVFRPWRRPTAGYSLQRLRCGGPCAPVLWPQSGAAGANGRRGGARPVRCRKKRETFRRKRGRIDEKSSLLFSKCPQCSSRRRPYTVRPFPLCRNRSGVVRAKTRAPPARLSVSALALRRNRGVPARLKRKPPCAIRRKSVILP